MTHVAKMRHSRLPLRSLHDHFRAPRLRQSSQFPYSLPARHSRPASTAREVAVDSRSLVTRLKNLFFGTSIVLGLGFFYLYFTDTRSGLHRYLVVPSLRLLYPDAEDAHEAGNKILRALYGFGLHPRERGNIDDIAGDLHVEVFGHVLSAPVGTSAGIDKHAEIPDPLLALGASIVELGGTTPYPQSGNEKPRVFRIPSHNALINRYGLNSEGAEHIAMRLRQRVREFAKRNGLGMSAAAERHVLDGQAGVPPGSLTPGKLLAVQVAKNKDTPDADIDAVAADYVFCVRHLARYADILVVNVSSPNTPGLRSLQATDPLRRILSAVVAAAAAHSDRASPPPAVMVKVSPDEDSDAQVAGIADAVFAAGVDGLVVGNTTNRRPAPPPPGYVIPAHEARVLRDEQGGYSGPQTFERTLALVKRYRAALDERTAAVGGGAGARAPGSPNHAPKVIFATGGISTGKQALQVLNAGASVSMVYTALVYGGVGTISAIKDEMRREIGSKAAIGEGGAAATTDAVAETTRSKAEQLKAASA